MTQKISVEKFLSAHDRESIRGAVKEAESKTAGEIVVLVVQRSKPHFSLTSAQKAFEKRAEQEFMKLGIQQTSGRTGVLIMLSLAEKMVSVKADRDINDKVERGAWQKTIDLILEGINKGKQGEGICNAIHQAGGLLAKHFPRKADDTNELPDDVVVEE